MQVESIDSAIKLREHSAIFSTCIRLREHSAILSTCIKLREHSAILSTCVKLPFIFETFVFSIFEWPLKTDLYLFVFVFMFFNNIRNSCVYKVCNGVQDLVDVRRLQIILSVKIWYKVHFMTMAIVTANSTGSDAKQDRHSGNLLHQCHRKSTFCKRNDHEKDNLFCKRE